MSEKEKAIESFKWWIDTNTEKGVSHIPDFLCNDVLKYINKLRKENEELKEDNSHQWEERCRLTFKLDKLQQENTSLKKEIKLMKSVNINENFISKDKIRNKIEELEKSENAGIADIYESMKDFAIEVLEELLGE